MKTKRLISIFMICICCVSAAIAGMWLTLHPRGAGNKKDQRQLNSANQVLNGGEAVTSSPVKLVRTGAENAESSTVTDPTSNSHATLQSDGLLILKDKDGNAVVSADIGKALGASRVISMMVHESNILIHASGRKTIFIDRSDGSVTYDVE